MNVLTFSYNAYRCLQFRSNNKLERASFFLDDFKTRVESVTPFNFAFTLIRMNLSD